MSTLKNHVQLIGNVGQEPTITTLESGKKVARFSLATNEYYKDKKGEKQTDTNWHTVVAWGKTAEIVEKYVEKGKEVGSGYWLRDEELSTIYLQANQRVPKINYKNLIEPFYYNLCSHLRIGIMDVV